MICATNALENVMPYLFVVCLFLFVCLFVLLFLFCFVVVVSFSFRFFNEKHSLVLTPKAERNMFK